MIYIYTHTHISDRLKTSSRKGSAGTVTTLETKYLCTKTFIEPKTKPKFMKVEQQINNTNSGCFNLNIRTGTEQYHQELSYSCLNDICFHCVMHVYLFSIILLAVRNMRQFNDKNCPPPTMTGGGGECREVDTKNSCR